MSKRNTELSDTTAVNAAVGQRFSIWLKTQFPQATAKHAAREFDASVPTAKQWTRGRLPANRHMLKMIARWRGAFLSYVFEPMTGPMAQLRADDEIRDLRTRLDRLEGELHAGTWSTTTANSDRAVDDRAPPEDGPVARDPGREMEGPLAGMDRRPR